MHDSQLAAQGAPASRPVSQHDCESELSNPGHSSHLALGSITASSTHRHQPQCCTQDALQGAQVQQWLSFKRMGCDSIQTPYLFCSSEKEPTKPSLDPHSAPPVLLQEAKLYF